MTNEQVERVTSCLRRWEKRRHVGATGHGTHSVFSIWGFVFVTRMNDFTTHILHDALDMIPPMFNDQRAARLFRRQSIFVSLGPCSIVNALENLPDEAGFSVLLYSARL
jgi:hypothetical protein